MCVNRFAVTKFYYYEDYFVIVLFDRESMFCDYYNAQQDTYCKRLKVLCPEHTKEPKVRFHQLLLSLCRRSQRGYSLNVRNKSGFRSITLVVLDRFNWHFYMKVHGIKIFWILNIILWNTETLFSTCNLYKYCIPCQHSCHILVI